MGVCKMWHMKLKIAKWGDIVEPLARQFAQPFMLVLAVTSGLVFYNRSTLDNTN